MLKFKIAKKDWMKVHTYLSLFFLPVCIIYVLTGVGYIFDFKENTGASVYEFSLQEPFESGKERDLILKILESNDLKVPNNTEVRVQKGAHTMGDIKYNASLAKNKDGQWVVKVTNRGIYGILLLMHKAKGSLHFNIIAVGFAISLLLFYFSGLIVTSFCKKDRKTAFLFFASGLFISALCVYLSI